MNKKLNLLIVIFSIAYLTSCRFVDEFPNKLEHANSASIESRMLRESSHMNNTGSNLQPTDNYDLLYYSQSLEGIQSASFPVVSISTVELLNADLSSLKLENDSEEFWHLIESFELKL